MRLMSLLWIQKSSLFVILSVISMIFTQLAVGVTRQNITFHESFEMDGFYASYSLGDPNATIEGNVQKMPGRNGGSAALFQNKGDLLRFSTQNNINLPQGTISLWVKEIDTSDNQLIWNPYFQLRGKDSVLNVVRPWQPAGVAGGLWRGGQTITLAMGPITKKDQWQHILFTWRKNERCMYVNGILSEKTSDGVFVFDDPAATFTLGRPTNPSIFVDGWHSGEHMLKDAPQRAAEMKIGQEPYGAYLLDDVAIFSCYIGPDEARDIFARPIETIMESGVQGSPSLSLQNYPSSRKVKINADFGKSLPADAKITAEVYELDGVSKGIKCDINQGPGGLEYADINTGSLDPGMYDVQVYVQSNGAVIAQTPKASFEVSAKAPWEDNTYGSEDVVLPGLEPLKADKKSVVMWGREYRFDGQAMPKQITNQGNKMLVRPINWFLKVGLDTYSLIPKSSKLISSSPTRAVYETEGVLGKMKVHGRVMVEYDGFMKFDLEFIPSQPVSVDQLYMDIPFTPSSATNLYYPTRRSGLWEKDWHSPLTLIYTNNMTMGTPETCLQWMTESDQHYYPRGSENALQTIEDSVASVFRTNVIGSTKKIDSPFKLTFALQAGPVKARPANWRAWTMSTQRANLNTKQYNDVGYHYDWWARSPGELIPRTGFPASCDPNLLKGQIQVASAHFAGFRSYDEPDATKRTPEWQLHENEWIRIPRMPDEGAAVPGWVNTYIDTNSSWSQWHVYNAYKLFSLTGMRGLYYDDWRQGPSMNEAAGSGYIDEDGIRRPILPIFSQRELHRRIYAIVKKARPDDGVVIIHTASQIFLPIISFCDVIYDGEVMIWADLIPPGGDYFKTFRNDLFQAMFTCKQYGPIPGYHDMTMQYARGFHDTVGGDLLFVPNQRKLWAILLTHDIHMPAAFTSCAEPMVNIWMDSFGIADPAIKFHPYWDSNPAARVLDGQEPESKFWASAYSKPDKVLVVVVRDASDSYLADIARNYNSANLGYSRPTKFKIKLDREKLGLPDGPLRCTSLESLGRSPMGNISGDILETEIEPDNFAGIIIEPAK